MTDLEPSLLRRARTKRCVLLREAGAGVLEHCMKTRNALGLHITSDDVRPTEGAITVESMRNALVVERCGVIRGASHMLTWR